MSGEGCFKRPGGAADLSVGRPCLLPSVPFYQPVTDSVIKAELMGAWEGWYPCPPCSARQVDAGALRPFCGPLRRPPQCSLVAGARARLPFRSGPCAILAQLVSRSGAHKETFGGAYCGSCCQRGLDKLDLWPSSSPLHERGPQAFSPCRYSSWRAGDLALTAVSENQRRLHHRLLL